MPKAAGGLRIMKTRADVLGVGSEGVVISGHGEGNFIRMHGAEEGVGGEKANTVRIGSTLRSLEVNSRIETGQ